MRRQPVPAPLFALALAQGALYALTGLWPLVSMRSFEWVTGPKVDRWLVKTVGVLVTVIGAVLCSAARRRRVTPEIAGLAASSALGLAGIDTFYGLRGRISRIYLLDAIVEICIALAWALLWFRRSRAGRSPGRSAH